MKASSSIRKSDGLALLATMCSLAVLLLVFVGVMYWISSNGKQLRRNQIFMSSQAAAEGVTEMVFAQMDRDYLFQSLNSASSYDSLAPITTNWPVQYTFNVNVSEGQQSGTLQYLINQYTNLLGEPQPVTITATATPVGQFQTVPSTVSQTIIFAEVPVFQFAIFYNLDLDMAPGDNMTVNGSTFCNENIWCYPSAQMTFGGSVEAAGNYFFHWDTNGEQASNITGSPKTPIFQDGTPLSHVDPLVLPIGAGTDSTTTNNSAAVEAIINIPPANDAAPQQIAYVTTNQVYLYNEVSLIVSNAAYGVNGATPWSNSYTVYLQDIALSPQSTPADAHWVQLTNDYYVISNRASSGGSLVSTPYNWVPNFQFTNNMSGLKWVNTSAGTNGPGPIGTNSVWYAGFSFLTNVFYYDYRESDTNETVQLDVSKLATWITNSGPNGGKAWNQDLANDTGKGIDSVFIYNDALFSSQFLPSVSVVNGALLPSSTVVTNGVTDFTCGLTVVTPQPLYVIGNYNVQTNGGSQVLGSHNTANTYPASFLADSITILSTNWINDWNKNSSEYASRPAANTTVNAACLEGIVPSNGGQTCGGDGSTAHYSGGIENFLRLLENWNNSGSPFTLTYNGSILVMFPSQYATNVWQQPGSTCYYSVPNRNWGFDTNFLIQSDLPPLTPNFRTVIRNVWAGN